MKDIALISEGTRIYFATCHDDSYPLENIIDGSWDTFWPTTGMFPHEFIVTFSGLMHVQSISIQSYNVKNLRIDKSHDNSPVNFETVIEKEFTHEERKLQNETLEQSCTAQHLRFVILSSYDHFVSIHNLQIMATPVLPDQPSSMYSTERDLRPPVSPRPSSTSYGAEDVVQDFSQDFREEGYGQSI